MPIGIYKHKPQPQEVRDKISKNNARYWLGKKRDPEMVKRVSEKLKSKKAFGKKSHRWKGMNVLYGSKHDWIEAQYGKAYRCDNPDCFYPRKNSSRNWILFPKRFHWANISKEYKRGISDYIQLCASCHARYDKIGMKLNIRKIRPKYKPIR